MSPTGEDAKLVERASAYSGRDIQELFESEGIELATAALYSRILEVQQNAAFLSSAISVESGPVRASNTLIGVVPGAFYKNHKGTNADGAEVVAIAHQLGCEAEVLPTLSFGTLAENARLIFEWLAQKQQKPKRIALVSLSKGSAELKWALSLHGKSSLFANVSTWISLSGTVNGTPLIEWLYKRPLRWWACRFWLWWHGYSGSALDEMRYGPGEPLASWPEIPHHLLPVHIYGFPTRQTLAHRWAPRAYERLAPLGPNDGGGVLLKDLERLPGIVCPVWGVDHYFMPQWDVTSMLRGIFAEALRLSERPQATQSENQPSAAPATRSSA